MYILMVNFKIVKYLSSLLKMLIWNGYRIFITERDKESTCLMIRLGQSI